MKKIYSLLLLTVVILCSCSKDDDNTAVLDLNGLLTKSETEFAGVFKDDPAGTYTYKNTFEDKSGFFIFDNYSTNKLLLGGGFTYTNKTDVTTPGYTNNSAITGKGINGNTYLTAYAASYTPALFKFKSNGTYTVKGAYVTNSTYAYLAIRDGYYSANKFVSGSWFKLTAKGLDKSGNETGTSADIYLADYRDGKSFIMNQWTWFDLSSLGKVAGVKFEMSSTDNGNWGMNTPAYFCMDGITIEL